MFVLGNTEWSNKGDLPCFFVVKLGIFLLNREKNILLGPNFDPKIR